MAKFKEGEVVIYTGGDFGGGDVEVVVVRFDGSDYFPYRIINKSTGQTTWAYERELSPLEESITLDDVKAKLQALEDKMDKLLGTEVGLLITLTSQSLSEEEQKSSPNALRKATIDAAKEFVDKVLEDTSDSHETFDEANESYNKYITKVQFIVNSKKRTVVAIAKRMYSPDEIVGKGIAKCHPNDVFNEDIGKAVAVIKLFGLEKVYEEETAKFFDAVEPTKLEVGMRVEYRGFDVEIKPEGSWCDYTEGTATVNSHVEHFGNITDDTKANYQ